MVHVFLDAGVDVNGTSSIGDSPFRRAVKNDHTSVFRQLLEHGGEIDAKDPTSSQTWLTGASRKGLTEMVTYLLNLGPIWILPTAILNPNIQGNRYPGPVEALAVMCVHYPTIPHTLGTGKSPLHWARLDGALSGFGTLECGNSQDATLSGGRHALKDAFGYTPLALAAISAKEIRARVIELYKIDCPIWHQDRFRVRYHRFTTWL